MTSACWKNRRECVCRQRAAGVTRGRTSQKISHSRKDLLAYQTEQQRQLLHTSSEVTVRPCTQYLLFLARSLARTRVRARIFPCNQFCMQALATTLSTRHWHCPANPETGALYYYCYCWGVRCFRRATRARACTPLGEARKCLSVVGAKIHSTSKGARQYFNVQAS